MITDAEKIALRRILEKNIRRLMAEREWTYEKLAQKCDMASQSTLIDIMSCDFDTKISSVQRIAKAFRVPAWSLLRDREKSA